MPFLLALLCGATVAAAVPTAAGASRGDRLTIGETLRGLRDHGRISADEYRRRTQTYRRARRALRHLRGATREALTDALDQLDRLADSRRLDGRLAPAFLSLDRNLEWYWQKRRGVPQSGARHLFEGSEIVFQHYAHAGWQIQPLASYGRLNALLTRRRPAVERARRLGDDLLALAVRRSGGLASEYQFGWGGAAPGWVSGMAAGTAVQSLARLWRATGDDRYLRAAQAMLFVFEHRPPIGVRAERAGAGAGPHYLLYSQSPRLLVGNGFIQALVGLHDYAQITGDPRGRGLYEEGLGRARATIERFDTGAWSLYSRRPGMRRGRESTLHYHRLFTTFLDRLCRRTSEPGVCELEQRFRAYEKQPVRIGRLRAATRGRRLAVRVWTNKRGHGRLSLLRGSRVVRSRAVSLERGTQVIRWTRPRGAGSYRLRMSAQSPTGLESRRERRLELRR